MIFLLHEKTERGSPLARIQAYCVGSAQARGTGRQGTQSGLIVIIWGRAPMMPLAVETWRVIFGCENRMLSNMTLLTPAFYHRFSKKANRPD